MSDIGRDGWPTDTVVIRGRDREIESLRTDYALLSDDYKQLVLDNESLRSRLVIESKAREGREALLRENESLCSRLADLEKALNGVEPHVAGLQARLAEAEALLRIAQKSCDRETAACIDAFLAPDSATHRENERD